MPADEGSLSMSCDGETSSVRRTSACGPLSIDPCYPNGTGSLATGSCACASSRLRCRSQRWSTERRAWDISTEASSVLSSVLARTRSHGWNQTRCASAFGSWAVRCSRTTTQSADSSEGRKDVRFGWEQREMNLGCVAVRRALDALEVAADVHSCGRASAGPCGFRVSLRRVNIIDRVGKRAQKPILVPRERLFCGSIKVC